MYGRVWSMFLSNTMTTITMTTISYKSKIKPVEVQYKYGGDHGKTKEIS